ncbi:monosaccharide ABC transporter substrate-binding protein (CUT2 family) [Scopulibacillus darangshiensis]|uniref:Monosaccharide ABC transporter substrate-binding protein (CUT2 family) n=1 Tax=Scopulibacillus darangshiensis TaxID=442528 RepID=A0A4R2P426_9BACL|nr:substrate-binding domain-containing protein [Scopulibacillus darangshiensis]TCP29559.1 monosaccharide ABC transporter substrate-binding protein (CUT2 family) [Scopulibacillus darangshiensis]
MDGKGSRKLFFIFMIFLCLLLLLSGGFNLTQHTQKPATTHKVHKNKNAEKRSFAIVYPVAHPFFQSVTQSAEETAKSLGVNVSIWASQISDVKQQIRIMEDLIQKHVDGIAIGPVDSEALTPIINKAVDEGIKVICFDTDAPNSKRTAYIGTNNYLAGRSMGEVVAQLLHGKGTIIGGTGTATLLNLKQRINGMKDVLKKYPNIKLLEIKPNDSIPNRALSNTEKMIRSHPHFDLFVGMDSLSGPAAITVWKAMGLKKELVTFDGLPIILNGIENGQVTATIAQREFTWGKLIIKRLNEACEGKEISEIEDTGTIKITKDNIKGYLKASH